MSFRAKRIEARIVNHALREDRIIVSAAGRHDRSRFLLVVAHGDDETRGFGEAATTTLWNGEAAETARWMVENVFAPKLEGAIFDHPREALEVMDGLSRGHPFAKSAIDTALWDLWTRSAGVPASKRFADREGVASIPTRASIGAYPVEETVRLALDFWEAGIRTLKFKTGVKPFDDPARLRAVRERLGDAAVFTVDANGGHASADEAVRAIEALLPYNIALAEQPTPRDRIHMLAEVRRRVPVPIMADEGVFTPGHLEEALDCEAFDILSVYPGKNGGFTRSLEMVQRAQRAGKTCAIGSNLETDLGQAAMAHLAAGCSAFPVEEVACDLPACIFYEKSSVTPPLAFEHGRVAVPTGPGFGVEPNFKDER